MILSSEQQAALDGILDWVRSPGQQSFVLRGYAGTGKTTLMGEVVRRVREEGIRVHCCAPTGKAAAVLQEKLGRACKVSTVHGFIYAPVEVCEEDLERAEQALAAMKARSAEVPHLEDAVRRAQERVEHVKRLLDTDMCDFTDREVTDEVGIVIADECSMIDEQMEQDLRRVAPKILFLGDGGQLPPVNGTPFFERNRPDAGLDQVHRQAGDSGILELATAIRRGECLAPRRGGPDVTVVRGEPSFELVQEADVILTGKNDTRRDLNRLIRHHRGFRGAYPEAGEQLMCLRNDHALRLVNGIGGVTVKPSKPGDRGMLVSEMMYEGEIRELQVDTFHFDLYEDPGLSRRTVKSRGSQFDYGYAITCHKAQGSEWPTVMVWDDHMREFDVEARRRWIYTAVTRAKQRLIWVDA